METRVCLLALCALLLVRFGGAAVTDDDQAAAASASEREAPEDSVAPEIPEDSVAPEAPEGPVAPEGPEAPEAGSSPEPIAHDAATASPSVADANTQTSGAVGSSGNGTSEGETNHEAPEGPGAPELKTDPNVQENQTTSQPLTPPPSPPQTSTTTNTITTINHSTTTTIPTDTTTTTNTSNITSNNTTTNTSNITSTTGPAHAANTTTAGTPTTTPPPPTSKTTHQAPLPDLVTPSDEPALNTTFPPPAATRPETAKPDTTATGVHVATWTPAAGVSSRGTTGSGSESPTQNAARADEHPGTSSEAQPRRTVGPPSSSPASSARAKAHADNPSQLNVGDDPTMVHDSPTLDPLLAGLVSAFIITAVVVTLLLFLKLRRRDNRPEFRRLQDLPMDDMMEDTPLSMYSY